MPITICTVSGTVKDNSGTPIVGVTVKANSLRSYIHPTDSSLILPFEVSTTTNNSGVWSLDLAETTTPAVTITISFFYPTGLNASTDRVEYTVTIPNAASATFASLFS